MLITISDIISRIQTDSEKLGIIVYDPASSLEIDRFEFLHDLKLPNDFKVFYKFCNGFESAEYLFRIIPLEEMLQNYLNSSGENSIAEYLVYSDMWLLQVNTDDSEDYTIYMEMNKEVVVLTKSFPEFLDKFLTNGVFSSGGLYDWRNP